MGGEKSADLILHSGKIITVNDRDEIAEAVAISDGRILFVGDNKSALSYAGPETHTIDLMGKTLMPGIIDSHVHMQWVGKSLQQINCRNPPLKSINEISEAVKQRVRESEPGEWIIGRGWDQVKLVEQRYPTRWDLDAVSPEKPVFLFRTCEHLGVANTKALEAAGITRDSPNPQGGKINKDSYGEPTGLLEELPALSLITSILPVEAEAKLAEAVETACKEFNKVGITSVLEPGLTPLEMRAYQHAHQNNRLTMRVNMMFMGNYQQITTDAFLKKLDSIQWITGYGDDFFRYYGLKLLIDGGFGGKTAYVREPYENDPNNYGLLIVQPDDLQKIVDAVNRLGMGVSIHCCGGAAMDVALEAYSRTDKIGSIKGRRFQIVHAYLPSKENIEVIKRLGVTVVSQPGFIYYLGDSYLKNVGLERISKTKPHRTWFDEGITVAGSSDGPVTPFNPWVGIWAAVARRTELGDKVVGPYQRITREEALRMYTINGAYMTLEEDRKGSIEPGKLADVIILDRDILTCPEDEIKDTKVLTTYLDGRVVYHA
jgi:hypothetical protein